MRPCHQTSSTYLCLPCELEAACEVSENSSTIKPTWNAFPQLLAQFCTLVYVRVVQHIFCRENWHAGNSYICSSKTMAIRNLSVILNVLKYTIRFFHVKRIHAVNVILLMIHCNNYLMTYRNVTIDGGHVSLFCRGPRAQWCLRCQFAVCTDAGLYLQLYS